MALRVLQTLRFGIQTTPRYVKIKSCTRPNPVAVFCDRFIQTTSLNFNGFKDKNFETDGEKKIFKILLDKFPDATEVDVKDISGGCGSMYEVYLTSTSFIGKRTVLQHRLVNEALKEEIKDMHGLRIFTSVP